MPGQYGHRPQRRRVFVGCEGKSEVGYAAFVRLLATEARSPVYLDIRNCRGSDPLAIVEWAIRDFHERKKRHGSYAVQAILLDADRRDDSPDRTDHADRLLQEHGFHAIWSQPTLEALLLKHIRGCEQLDPATNNLSLRQLKRHWPDYYKGMTGRELRARLNLAAVSRAAAVVPALRAFLHSVDPRLGRPTVDCLEVRRMSDNPGSVDFPFLRGSRMNCAKFRKCTEVRP